MEFNLSSRFSDSTIASSACSLSSSSDMSFETSPIQRTLLPAFEPVAPPRTSSRASPTTTTTTNVNHHNYNYSGKSLIPLFSKFTGLPAPEKGRHHHRKPADLAINTNCTGATSKSVGRRPLLLSAFKGKNGNTTHNKSIQLAPSVLTLQPPASPVPSSEMGKCFCGTPLDKVANEAFDSDDGVEIYCSRECARQDALNALLAGSNTPTTADFFDCPRTPTNAPLSIPSPPSTPLQKRRTERDPAIVRQVALLGASHYRRMEALGMFDIPQSPRSPSPKRPLADGPAPPPCSPVTARMANSSAASGKPHFLVAPSARIVALEIHNHDARPNFSPELFGESITDCPTPPLEPFRAERSSSDASSIRSTSSTDHSPMISSPYVSFPANSNTKQWSACEPRNSLPNYDIVPISEISTDSEIHLVKDPSQLSSIPRPINCSNIMQSSSLSKSSWSSSSCIDSDLESDLEFEHRLYQLESELDSSDNDLISDHSFDSFDSAFSARERSYRFDFPLPPTSQLLN